MQAVLEELLLRARLVDVPRMRRAKEIVLETGCTLAHALVKLGFVTDRGLASLLSQALSLRVVDPSRLDVDASAIGALAGPVAHRLRVLPIRLRTTAEGEFIYVAMSDPTDRDAVREVEATTGRELVPAVAEEKALERALRRHYAREALTPVNARVAPSVAVEDDPPLVVGVLDLPPTDSMGAPGRDEDVRAELLAKDDGDYFTESTEELMTVYSRALARAERGAEDKDLMWLEERREIASGADVAPVSSRPPAAEERPVWPPRPATPPPVQDYEDIRTAPLSVEQLERVSAPTVRAVPLQPPSSLPPGEERTEPDLKQALHEAKRAMFRPPTCVVADDLELRSLVGAGLAGYIADLHVEPSLADALSLGEQVPLGYVVVVAPQAEPAVVRDLQRVSEMAGSPRVVVVGGEAAFQVVPGVEAWVDLIAVGKARMCDEIVATLHRLEGP